jgi:RNA polymerase sigma factor (sigma-70 family)
MQTAPLGTVLRHIRNVALALGTRELTDTQLLKRFAVHQDADAFAALMQRYGQLVWGVCRHVLRHDHDAEDAFQATFLVLARSSASIRKQEALASWLHGTAYRIALRARRDTAVRRTHENRGQSMPADKHLPETDLREALAMLDEEVQCLAPRQRAAFVLCSLEGKSLAEAAQQLGWKQGTVSGTLTRARRQLEQRLTRRGVTLTAVLSAVVLGRQVASAAVPAGLARATTQAALLYAAGKTPAAALASPAAAALAEGVTKTMFLTKLKVATMLLLAVGVAGLLTRQALVAQPFATQQVVAPQASAQDTKPPAPKREDNAPPADHGNKADEALEVKGQVLGPDGKPCAGAKLFLWTNAVKDRADMPVLATTGADGRFRLTIAKAYRNHDAKIVARAKTHGPDWVEVARLDKGGEVTLRLAKDDVPIDGRVIDLEGQPVAGATIEVGRLEQSEMKVWIETAKKGVSNHQERELASVALDGPTSVTTGKDGRFRLTGFGRERVVLLRLRGDNIEHCVFWVVMRDEPLTGMRGGPYGTYSATFTHHALPSKPIVGTIRDKATGKPLPGIAVVSSMYNNRWTKTDEKGRYRIVGAAKHERYSVSAGSAPYLNCTKMDIADTPGLEPLTVDFELERGVAIKGRLTDKTTGQPVRGWMGYIPLADNPHIKDFSELGKLQIIASDEAQSKADGLFTVTAIPGPGVLVARADDEDRFVAAEVEGIKLAQSIILDGYHAVIPVNPSGQDPKSTHYDIALVPGRALSGTVLGPDGQPLSGAHAAGLGATPKFFARSEGKLATASFSVRGLSPKKSRTVLLMHPEKRLAKLQIVRPDESDPLTVRLEPLGALTGRVVAANGKPLAGLKVRTQLSFKPENFKNLPTELRFNIQTWSKYINREATTDGDGRFRIEGLVPGVKYLLNVTREMEFLSACTREDLTVEAGKAKDLGELQDKPSAKRETQKQP